MAISKAKKVETLAKLSDRSKRSAAAVFVSFKGMTVENTVKLRKFFVTNGIDYQVAKKTLMRLMAEESGVADFDQDMLDGAVGVAFGYTDEVTLAKTIRDQTKQFDTLKIVAGIVDKKMVTGDVITTLASLPSREELLAKFVGTLVAPLRGFVGSLQSPISGFVRTLQAYSEKKTA